jgi:biopolymer transport protein ExbD
MASSFTAGYADEEDGSLSGINVTPLVDVTLVLLIVFMITVPAIVSSARLKVDLPETTTVAADTEQTPLTFVLKRLASGPVLLYLNNAPIDEAGVRNLFSQSIDRNAERQASLSADRGIEYGEVVRVVDLLESLGLHKLSLDTRHVESR